MGPVEADETLRGWIKLAALGAVEGPALVRLLREYPDPAEIFDADHRSLRKLAGADFAGEIRSSGEELGEIADSALGWLRRTPGAFALTLADADYPQGLLGLACPPVLLFAQGNRALLKRRLVTVLGSRSPTAEGKEIAFSFGKGLARAGFSLLSPMMDGIDAASLQGALHDSGQAGIALCATPLDRVYPSSARELFSSVVRNGLALSRQMPGTLFCKENLLDRYRLLAAMCNAVVVMEAGIHSKALPFARRVAEMGKDVFAVPGTVSRPLSKGPNRLIRDGVRLVESAQDIAQEMTALSSPAPVLSDEP